MATIIQTRNDTAANWTSANPTLAKGEMGLETDTGKIKFGDGVTSWTSLSYFKSGNVDSVNGQTGAVVLVIPTDTGDLTNGAGFITSSALTGYATETWVGQQGYLTSTALNGYATETWVGNQGYITGITSSDVTTALGFTPATSTQGGKADSAIQGVQVNGTDLTPDENNKVNVVLTSYEEKATIETLDATDSITLADNTIYNGGEQTALTIALPATVDVSFLCEVDFTSGATPATLAYPNTIKWLGDDVANNVFVPVASKRYTIICAYDGVNYRFTVKGVA